MTEMEDTGDGAGLDGSVGATTQLLAELAALAGQHVAGSPVLELVVGDITTFTSVDGDCACLLVTARLPAEGISGYLPPGAQVGQRMSRDGIDCSWQADQGCHVVVRAAPLASLPHERSLMDAILDTADAARAWHLAIAGGRTAASASIWRPC